MRRLLGGLRARVILTYLIIFLVSTAIMVGRTGSLFTRIALESAEHDLRAETYVMALALERPLTITEEQTDRALSLAQLQALTSSLAERSARQMTIFDTHGDALATSLAGVPTSPQTPPEVTAALAGDLQQNVRRDPVTGQEMIYAAAPITSENHIFGAVQMSVLLDQALASVRAFWLSLILTALLAAAAAALAGWVLAGQLVRPVARLRDAAGRLAGGDLDERVPAKDTGGIVEIVQLADAFNDMAARIQDTLNRQRQFVADASHELRTPLTNIKLRAEALGNGALDDQAVAQRFVGEIESEANRLSRMASDLLTLSRDDAGAPVFRERVDPSELVGHVLDEMSLRAGKAGVDLVGDVEPKLPTIDADPVGLHTVLLNLVDNALQYTPNGGRVVIRACKNAVDQAAAELGRWSLILSVCDTGAGIPAEDLPYIFDRFYRADKARSRRMAQRVGTNTPYAGSGAGLGLAIVRGIVEEHGGTVSAASVAGQGTTMTVELPASL